MRCGKPFEKGTKALTANNHVCIFKMSQIYLNQSGLDEKNGIEI